MNSSNNFVFHFGKYKDKPLSEVIDLSYLGWVLGEVEDNTIDYEALADRIVSLSSGEYRTRNPLNKEEMLDNRNEWWTNHKHELNELGYFQYWYNKDYFFFVIELVNLKNFKV